MKLQAIISQLSLYLTGLDWSYIITFILLAYGANQQRAKDLYFRVFKIRTLTRYRTLIIGLVYAIVLFLLRGSDIEQIERLLRSLVFAMVFHQLLLEKFVEIISGGPSCNNKTQSDDGHPKE